MSRFKPIVLLIILLLINTPPIAFADWMDGAMLAIQAEKIKQRQRMQRQMEADINAFKKWDSALILIRSLKQESPLNKIDVEKLNRELQKIEKD